MTNITLERNGSELRFYSDGLLLAVTNTQAETAYVMKEMERIYKQEQVFAKKSAKMATVKRMKKLLES